MAPESEDKGTPAMRPSQARSAPAEQAAARPFTETPEFWVLMAYAVALGVFGAFTSLAFLGVIGGGNNWFSSSDFGWFGGNWWWVAVTAAAGVAVGLLHRLTGLPGQTPGLIADLQKEYVETRSVPGIVAVSAVSLIGGASLGPEKALGAIGGGAAGWSSKRRGLGDEDRAVNTLVGFAGAYGGMFSAVVVVVMLIVEVARPGGVRLAKAVAGMIVSSSISFGIYFAIAGSLFLDAYQVPAYEYEDWQLAAGVGFGLLAAVIVTLLAVLTKLAMGLFGRVNQPIVRATIGGALFGLVGVVLPLTMFTGSDQLTSVISDAGTLGVALLVALVIAKIVAFAVCQASGFVGGPIFPALFIGGTAGVAFHEAFSSVPLGLAFTCLFAAVPGGVVAAPFSMVLLAAFMTQVGSLQTAPILIAVVTSFLVMEGVKYAIVRRKQEATPAEKHELATPAAP
jgi:H+/Cl- antiporter ClcA